MNLFGVMGISGSALTAQRQRAEVSAANMANAETTRTENGVPYQRRHVVLQAGNGGANFADTLQGHHFGNMYGAQGSSAQGVSVVGVVDSTAPPVLRYDPSHPDADANGYVAYPDINPVSEMVDLVGASRAYSLNAGALQAEKGMLSASLELLK